VFSVTQRTIGALTQSRCKEGPSARLMRLSVAHGAHWPPAVGLWGLGASYPVILTPNSAISLRAKPATGRPAPRLSQSPKGTLCHSSGSSGNFGIPPINKFARNRPLAGFGCRAACLATRIRHEPNLLPATYGSVHQLERKAQTCQPPRQPVDCHQLIGWRLCRRLGGLACDRRQLNHNVVAGKFAV